tara:strand:+ start:1127 stop:1756 length:630 start_codon:yes stop_codon:yes gene_type:complete
MNKLFPIVLALLFFSCAEEDHKTEKPIHGCLDSKACNYNSDATIDNNSCDYRCIDDCGVLNGDNSSCVISVMAKLQSEGETYFDEVASLQGVDILSFGLVVGKVGKVVLSDEYVPSYLIKLEIGMDYAENFYNDSKISIVLDYNTNNYIEITPSKISTNERIYDGEVLSDNVSLRRIFRGRSDAQIEAEKKARDELEEFLKKTGIIKDK